MKQLVFFALILIGLATGESVNVTHQIGNNTNARGRSGRWVGDNDPQYSAQFGYYASPDEDDDSDERIDKGKYSLPTSFADFKPDTGDDKKFRFQPPLPPPPPPSAWKGDTQPAPWMFPSDVFTMMNAVDVEEKPTGLLAKLKKEPLTILLAAAIPLSVLLAAVLPTLINMIMTGNMSPPVTTIASGNRTDTGRHHKSTDPSLVVKILEAVEDLSALRKSEDLCFQKIICHVSKRINGTKYRSIQQNVLDIIPFVPDTWLESFGLKEMQTILKTENCSKVKCSSKPKSKASVEKKRHNSHTTYNNEKKYN
ncbi:hypothetical protein AVEN_275338-1 [Araneus ventricosus]|uniref:Uncharacterized protein n=1 Tax=Araneus ventricosus TaxID=182803 RepID=A0A4Y2KUE1_ARAVE|nr:hypothetical protein AVEN_275338-1 [Araneus ventricosus]